MPPLPLRPQVPAPAIWLVALVAAVQAWMLWPLSTPHMAAHLPSWLDAIRERGTISAFIQSFPDYLPSHLYLLAAVGPLAERLDPVSVIKLLSIAGTAALALSFHRLLGAIGAPQRAQWAIAIAAFPPVVFNALYLGRYDGFHLAACVMAVATALERRHAAMFAWCGIAVAFEAGAMLIAPFILALAIRRRVPFSHWLAAPAVLLVMLAPALLAGWPPADLAAIHFRQAGAHSADMARTAPNIWSLVQMISPEQAPRLLGLALAAALGTVAAYAARMQVVPFDKAGLVAMAALAVLLGAGLLPHLHERYFLLAGMLLFAFAIARGTRDAFALAALVQLGSTTAIIGDIGLGLPMTAIGAACMIAATRVLAQPLIAPHANDNCDGSHGIPLPYGLRGTLSFDMMMAPVARPRGE